MKPCTPGERSVIRMTSVRHPNRHVKKQPLHHEPQSPRRHLSIRHQGLAQQSDKTHHKTKHALIPLPSHALGAVKAKQQASHPILRQSSPRDTRSRRDLASNRPASISASGLCYFRDRGARAGKMHLSVSACLSLHIINVSQTGSPRQCMSRTRMSYCPRTPLPNLWKRSA